MEGLGRAQGRGGSLWRGQGCGGRLIGLIFLNLAEAHFHILLMPRISHLVQGGLSTHPPNVWQLFVEPILRVIKVINLDAYPSGPTCLARAGGDKLNILLTVWRTVS